MHRSIIGAVAAAFRESPESAATEPAIPAVDDAVTPPLQHDPDLSEPRDPTAGGEDREAAEGPIAPSIPTDPALSSPSTDRRREALLRRLAEGAPPGETAALIALLQHDPDPQTRGMAAEALATDPDWIPLDVLRSALLDPSDPVRATVVQLAAARGPEALALLLTAATDRHWPLAQEAALATLPDLLSAGLDLSEPTIDSLLDSIGQLDPPPLPHERPGLSSVARAIGSTLLRSALDGPSRRRRGAAWMLFLEGAPDSLSAVAALQEADDEALRELARTAARVLSSRRRRAEPSTLGAGSTPDGTGGSDPSNMAFEALASALSDPDEAVRSVAGKGLRNLPQETSMEWVTRMLGHGTDAQAEVGADVVGYLELRPAAPALLNRASRSSGERGAYVRALAALELGAEELVSLVSSVDPSHRQTAVRLVWQVAGHRTVPFLPALLSDSAGPVRMAVLEVIGESRDHVGVRLARELLAGDSSAAVRAAAVHLLARGPADARLEALGRALADPDPDVRATAVQLLPPDDLNRMAESLLPALRDPDPRVWRAVLPHLARVPQTETRVLWHAIKESPPAKREELVRAIEQVDHSRLEALVLTGARADSHVDRELAVDLAARAGTPDSTAVVVETLRDPDPRVRRAAASAMMMLRTPAAVEALAARLSDPNVEVRIAALRALGVIDDDAVPDVLISAMKDPELRVRRMAADALTRWRSPAVARRLAAALRSAELRRSVGEVLERMGEPAVDPLVAVVIGRDPEAAAEAGSVLERIVGPEPFIRGAASTDPEERLQSVEVLGVMGGPVAVGALLASLSDPEARVRGRAAALLGGLGEARAAKELRRMVLGDPVPEVAQAAETALRLLETIPIRNQEEVSEDFPQP